MTVEEFRKAMAETKYIPAGSELHKVFHALSQDALKLTAELNGAYHTPEEVRTLMSQLTAIEIDESFGLFPPFHTDCGKNTKIGKRVFITYAGEIESAVMVLHGEKAHSRYFGETAFKMLKGDNKELVIVPGASHCDLYDGGGKDAIPFDSIEAFYRKILLPGAGSLVRAKHNFVGWQLGTAVWPADAEFALGDQDVVLQAAWEAKRVAAPVISVAERFSDDSTIVTMT